ncbi:MAG TPA: hypothetical protein PKD91_16865, partial [Bacteroidia bacterium]|nr:hypothetical protein [Bacteroidia bacterium]
VGFTIECQVLQVNNPGLTSNSIVFTFIAVPNILNIIPPITVSCPARVSGYIKNCDGSTSASALLYISWNGGSYLGYTTTGYYNIIVPATTNLIINADAYNFHTQTSINSGVVGTTTTAPDLKICSPTPLATNEFTLKVNGASTDYVMFPTLMTSSFTDSDNDGTFESATINIFGYVMPGSKNTTIQIGLFNEVNGYYSLLQTAQSNVYITIDSVGTYGNGNFGNITTNRLKITDYGLPGGVMNAEYEFDHFAGTLTKGKFSITRGN